MHAQSHIHFQMDFLSLERQGNGLEEKWKPMTRSVSPCAGFDGFGQPWYQFLQWMSCWGAGDQTNQGGAEWNKQTPYMKAKLGRDKFGSNKLAVEIKCKFWTQPRKSWMVSVWKAQKTRSPFRKNNKKKISAHKKYHFKLARNVSGGYSLKCSRKVKRLDVLLIANLSEPIIYAQFASLQEWNCPKKIETILSPSEKTVYPNERAWAQNTVFSSHLDEDIQCCERAPCTLEKIKKWHWRTFAIDKCKRRVPKTPYL